LGLTRKPKVGAPPPKVPQPKPKPGPGPTPDPTLAPWGGREYFGSGGTPPRADAAGGEVREEEEGQVYKLYKEKDSGNMIKIQREQKSYQVRRIPLVFRRSVTYYMSYTGHTAYVR
jgi:hypothetical protein